MSAPAVTAPKTWASLESAAEYLECSTKTVRRYIASGKLRAYRVAGRSTIRVRWADLDALMQPLPAADAAKGAW